MLVLRYCENPKDILKVIKTYYNVSKEFYNIYLNENIEFIEFEIRNNLNKCFKLIESIVFFGALYGVYARMKKDLKNGFYENVFMSLNDIITIIENRI